jgi:hypothetical protein
MESERVEAFVLLAAAATRTRVWVYSCMLALTDSALARIAIRLPASGVTGRTKLNGINDCCKLFCG